MPSTVVAKVSPRTLHALPLALLASVFTGCVSVEPDAGFSEVQELIERRTSQNIAWRTGGPEDHALDEAIEQMLGQPLTADTAAQIALLNNRHLQATYEELGVAQADLVQAGLLSNPVFSTSVTFPTESGTIRPNLGVTQSFLDIFYRPLRERVAEADLAAMKQHVAEQVLDHAVRTRSAFYRVQTDQQIVDVLDQVVAETGESLETMRELHAANQVAYLDLRNKEGLYEQTRLALTQAQTERELSRERLNILMGLRGEQLAWEAEPELPALPPEEPTVDAIEQEAVDNSLALAALTSQIEAAASQMTLIERAALLPTADVGIQAQRRSPQWFVGPQLSLPLPVFDQGQAQQATATARHRQHQHRYEATAIEVRSAARQAMQRLQTARHVVDYYGNVLLPLRQEIYEDSVLQYNVMEIGILDLIDAREQQLDTQRDYTEALYGYWVARTELEQTIAGGMPESIIPPPAASIPAGGASGR